MSVKHIEYLKVKDSKVLVVEVRPVKCLLDTPSGPTHTDKWMEYSHWKELYHLLTDIVEEYEEQKTTLQIKYDQPECKTGATIQIGYMFSNLPSCWCSLYFLIPRKSCTWMEKDDKSGGLQDKGGRFEDLVACGEILVVSVILRDSPALSTREGVHTPNCSGSFQQAPLNQKLMKALDNRIEYISSISDYFKTSAAASSDSSAKNGPSSSKGGKRKLPLRVKAASSTSFNEGQERKEVPWHVVGQVADGNCFDGYPKSHNDSGFTFLEPDSQAELSEKDLLCDSTTEYTNNLRQTNPLDNYVLWNRNALAVTNSKTNYFEQSIESPMMYKYECYKCCDNSSGERCNCFVTLEGEGEEVSSDLESSCYEHRSLIDNSASSSLGKDSCVVQRDNPQLENVGFEPQAMKCMAPSPTCESDEKGESENALGDVSLSDTVQKVNIGRSKDYNVLFISNEMELQNSLTGTSAQMVMSWEDNGVEKFSEDVDMPEMEGLDDKFLHRDEDHLTKKNKKKYSSKADCVTKDVEYLSGIKYRLCSVENSIQADDSVHHTQDDDLLAEERNHMPQEKQQQVQAAEGNILFTSKKVYDMESGLEEDSNLFIRSTDRHVPLRKLNINAPQKHLSPKRLLSQENYSAEDLHINEENSLSYPNCENFQSLGSNEECLQQSAWQEANPLIYENILNEMHSPLFEDLMLSETKSKSSSHVGHVKEKIKPHRKLINNLEVFKPEDDHRRMEEVEEVPSRSVIPVIDEDSNKSHFFLETNEVYSYSESHQSECRSSHDCRVSGSSSQDSCAAITYNPQLENIGTGPQTESYTTRSPSDESGKQNNFQNVTHKGDVSGTVQKTNVGHEDCSVRYLSHEMETQSSFSPEYEKRKQLKMFREGDRMAELFGEVDEPEIKTEVQDGVPSRADEEYVPQRIMHKEKNKKYVPKRVTSKEKKKCKRNLLNMEGKKKKCKRNLVNTEFEYVPSDLRYLSGTKDGLYSVEDSVMQADESVHNTQVSEDLPLSTEERDHVPEGEQLKVQATEGSVVLPTFKKECNVENVVEKDSFYGSTEKYIEQRTPNITKASQECLPLKKLPSQDSYSAISLHVNGASCSTSKCSSSLNCEYFQSPGSNKKSLQSTRSDYLKNTPLKYNNSSKNAHSSRKALRCIKYLKSTTQQTLDGDQHGNLVVSKAKCVSSCQTGSVKKKIKTLTNFAGNLEMSEPENDERIKEAGKVPCSSVTTVTGENNDKSHVFFKVNEVYSHSESQQSEYRLLHDWRVSGSSSQDPYAAIMYNPQLENIGTGPQNVSCMILSPSDESGKQNNFQNVTYETCVSNRVQKTNVGGREERSVGYLSHEIETQSSFSPEYEKSMQLKMFREDDRMAELFGEVDEPEIKTEMQGGAPSGADEEYVPQRVMPKGKKKCKRNLLNTVPTNARYLAAPTDVLYSAEDPVKQTSDSVQHMQVLEDLPLSVRKRDCVPEGEQLKVQADESSVLLSTCREQCTVDNVLLEGQSSFSGSTKKCFPHRKPNTTMAPNRLPSHINGESHIRTDYSQSSQNCENVQSPELRVFLQQSTVHDHQEADQFTCHQKRVKERYLTESLRCLRIFQCKQCGNVEGSHTKCQDFEQRNKVSYSNRGIMKGNIYTDLTEESEKGQIESKDKIEDPALENNYFDPMSSHNRNIFSSSYQEHLDAAEDIVQPENPGCEQHQENYLISSPTSASPKQSKTQNGLRDGGLHNKEKENLGSSENEINSRNSSAVNYNLCVQLERSWEGDRMVQFSKNAEEPKIQMVEQDDASPHQSDRQDEKMSSLRRSNRLKGKVSKNLSGLYFSSSGNEDLREGCSKGKKRLSAETEKLMKFFQNYAKEKNVNKDDFKQKKIIDYVKVHNTSEKQSDEERDFKCPKKKKSAATEKRKKSKDTNKKQKDVKKKVTKKSLNEDEAIEMSSKPSSSKQLSEMPRVSGNYYNEIWNFTFPNEQTKKNGKSNKSFVGKKGKNLSLQKRKSISPKNLAKERALGKETIMNMLAVSESESELDVENRAPGTLNDEFFLAIQAEMEQFSVFLKDSDNVLGSSKSSHSILKMTEELNTLGGKGELLPAKKANLDEEELVVVATRTLASLKDSYMRLQKMTESDLEQCMDENLPYLERVIQGAEPNERHKMFNTSISLLKRQPDYLICGPFTADQSECVLDLLKKKLSHLDRLIENTFDLLTYRCRVLLPTFLTKIVMDNENMSMKEAEELMVKFSLSQHISGNIDGNDWRKF